MTDWKNLETAYGSAENVPAMIAAWRDDPSDENAQELWGHLCHQGSVYSASFAAISLLLEASEGRAPKLKREMIMLVAAIVASRDVRSGIGPDEGVRRRLPSLEEQAVTHLGDDDVDEVEAVYLLQAAAAFRGDKLWGNALYSLADEFSGICPNCREPLQFDVDADGPFCTALATIRRQGAERCEIVPASTAADPQLATISTQALRHGRAKISDKLRYVVGYSRCALCGADISVLDAIGLWEVETRSFVVLP